MTNAGETCASTGPLDGERSRLPVGACLLLGLAIALLNTTLPDAVLLPAVDRLPPRHLGLAIDGVLLSLGAWAMSRSASGLGRGRLMLLGAASLVGSLTSATLLPPLHDWLASGLRGEGFLPYYPLVVLASAAAAAPAALPLGGLLAVALGTGRRGALAALLAGLAGGFMLAPWSADVLLGATRTLHVTALVAASAALLFAERTPRPVRGGRLMAGGGAAALALGAALVVAVRLVQQQSDRGPLVGPALAALLCLAAMAGLLLPAPRSLPLFIAAVAAGLPALCPAQTWIPRELVRDTGAELFTLSLMALPAGLLLGGLAQQALGAEGRRRAGASTTAFATQAARSSSHGAAAGRVPLTWLPALLLLPAPFTTLVLLPHVGARAAAVLAAALVVLVLARQWRQQLAGLLTLAIVAALSLGGVGPPPPPEAVRADDVVHLPDGDAALVRDPETGRRLLAIDGHAAFGRSAGQERRFALLPLLLWGHPQRVLVIASGFGETASAAWSTGLNKLHWLRPFAHPERWNDTPWPGEDPPTVGSERQFLAVPRERYDAIIMAPDVRVASRGALVGSSEFYALAQERLATGGLLCQWWDLADTDISDLKAVIASATEVFPFCSLIMDHPRTRRACVGLLLSGVPLSVEPSTIDMVLAENAVLAADIHGIGLDGLSMAALVSADRGLLELMAPAESAIHDDRPVLGVQGALRSEGGRQRLLTGLTTLALQRRDPMPWILVPPDNRYDVSLLVRDRFRAWQHLFGGAQRVVAEAGPAGAPFERESPGSGPDSEAASFLQALAPMPDSHELVELVLGRASFLQQQGRPDEADTWLRQAIAIDAGNPALHFALGRLQERRGMREDAAVHYTSVLTIDPGHGPARDALDALRAAGIALPEGAPLKDR